MARQDDLDFANDVRAAMEHGASRYSWVVLAAVILMIGSGIAWASFAVLEEVTRGQGKVIPSRQIQVVQTLDGGIVTDILVREGDLVAPGQTLIQIDDTDFSSRLGELRQKRWALLAEAARLVAEAEGHEAIALDEALLAAAPDAVTAQRNAFRARQQRTADEVTVLGEQLRQRQLSVTELEATRTKLEATREPLARELTLTQRLNKRGAVPEIEVLRLQRDLAAADGELAVVNASMPRAQSAIVEAQRKVEIAKAAVSVDAREQLTRVRSDLAVIEETLKAAEGRVRRTALKAPVRGIVNTIHATTLGAVVQPGRDIVEIVPLDEGLLVETRVRPRDVAFIRPEQKASVKLTAYDFLIYGALAGRVERISADTIADQNGEAFYRVMIKTDQNHIAVNGRSLPIIPGMLASVDIQTGEKTVLDYLLKPVLRARHEALRER